jgi:hypothetical protein
MAVKEFHAVLSGLMHFTQTDHILERQLLYPVKNKINALSKEAFKVLKGAYNSRQNTVATSKHLNCLFMLMIMMSCSYYFRYQRLALRTMGGQER